MTSPPDNHDPGRHPSDEALDPDGLQLPPYLTQDRPTRGHRERPAPARERCPVSPRDIALAAGSVIAGAIGTQMVVTGYSGLLQGHPVRVSRGSVLAVAIACLFGVILLPAIVRFCSPRRWSGSATAMAVLALGAAVWGHLRLEAPVLWLQAKAVFAVGVAVVLAAAGSYYLLTIWPVRTKGPADPDPNPPEEQAAQGRRAREAAARCGKSGLWWAVLAYPLFAAVLCLLLVLFLA